MKVNKYADKMGEKDCTRYEFTKDSKVKFWKYYDEGRDLDRFIMKCGSITIDSKANIDMNDNKIYNKIYRPMRRALKEMEMRSLTTK